MNGASAEPLANINSTPNNKRKRNYPLRISKCGIDGLGDFRDALEIWKKPHCPAKISCTSFRQSGNIQVSKLSIKSLTTCGPPQRCGQILENEFCRLGTLRWWWRSVPRTRDGGLPPRCCSDHLFMGFLRNLLFTCCRRTTQRLLTTARESS